MDISRGSYYEKNAHLNSTIQNETGSSFSSDSDKTPKPYKKKKKGKKTSKKSSTLDYFPMYTPPWATMNYIYLDLLRQLSLESEIRTSLTQMDTKYDYSYLKGLQAKKRFEEEQCCERIKTKHKHISCEDFEMSCSKLCLSCLQKNKCRSCGKSIMHNRDSETDITEIKPLKYGKSVHDSCSTFCDNQHIYFSHCHCQKPMHPCHSIRCNICDNLNHETVDPPVRERLELNKSSQIAQSTLNSEACIEPVPDPNFDNLLSENCLSMDNCTAKQSSTKNQPDLQVASNDVKKFHFENDFGTVPSFLGGTGDERSKLQGKPSRKSRLPQSTAYFLPISSLSTDKSKMNFPRFNS